MPETLAALILAHVLADFIFQTNWMVANKRDPFCLFVHTLIVLATAVLLTGSFHPALFVLAAVHAAIDAAKEWSPWKGLAAFLTDQGLHLGSVIAVALWVPDLWAAGGWNSGFWANQTEGGSIFGNLLRSTDATHIARIAPPLMALTAGFIIATRMGGFAVGLCMARWQMELSKDSAKDKNEGLPDGGRAIGLLERGLIFLLVLSGQAASIGFLIAAKSVLRFGAVSDDRKFSEYVIIGTLASFGWAIATAFATIACLGLLSPLGIPLTTP